MCRMLTVNHSTSVLSPCAGKVDEVRTSNLREQMPSLLNAKYFMVSGGLGNSETHPSHCTTR